MAVQPPWLCTHRPRLPRRCLVLRYAGAPPSLLTLRLHLAAASINHFCAGTLTAVLIHTRSQLPPCITSLRSLSCVVCSSSTASCPNCTLMLFVPHPTIPAARPAGVWCCDTLAHQTRWGTCTSAAPCAAAAVCARHAWVSRHMQVRVGGHVTCGHPLNGHFVI